MPNGARHFFFGVQARLDSYIGFFFASGGILPCALLRTFPLDVSAGGWPSRVRGEKRVVSTASGAPFRKGKPLAVTSMQRSSCWWGWLVLKGLTLLFVVAEVPASVQIRAIAVPVAFQGYGGSMTGRKLRSGRCPECDGTGRCEM